MKSREKLNWQDVSVTSDEFLSVVNNTWEAIQFLHEYFSINTLPNELFLKELAEHYPELLIKAIRLNQVFLNPQHKNSIAFLKNHKNDYLKKHYEVADYVANVEQHLYQAIEAALKHTISFSCIEVMCCCALWFEQQRAQLFKEKDLSVVSYDLSQQTEVLDFFLYTWFKQVHEQTRTISSFTDDVLCTVTLLERPDLITHPVWKLLEQIKDYLYFQNGLLSSYSYELHYEVEDTNTAVFLACKNNTRLLQWDKEEEKLKYWYSYYRQHATDVVNQSIASGELRINKRTHEDEQMNYEGSIRTMLSKLIAEDYEVWHSEVNGVPVQQVLEVMNGFSINAWGRFVNLVDPFYDASPENWQQHLVTHLKKERQKGFKGTPTRLYNEQELIDQFTKQLAISQQTVASMLECISTDVSSEAKGSKINLWNKPFLKINTYYFAFNGIMGESNTQTNVLNNILYANESTHFKQGQAEVKKMEKRLQQLFIGAGFTNCLCSIDYYLGKERKGDFDVVVYENGILLLIEMKRTRVRVKLNEIHDEFMLNIRKASYQLDKAISFINAKFNACKSNFLKDLSIKENAAHELKGIYTLIVSTSFEQDHQLIENKHLKISWFELTQFLQQVKESKTKPTLFEVITDILNESFWNEKQLNVPPPNPNRLRYELYKKQ
jgi:hypothetical protein